MVQLKNALNAVLSGDIPDAEYVMGGCDANLPETRLRPDG